MLNSNMEDVMPEGGRAITNIPEMKPDMTMEERKQVWLAISDMTEQEFDDMRAWQKGRQLQVPEAGSEAPDFEIDVLDRKRRRSGETIQLSSLRGKPVALVFGSYT